MNDEKQESDYYAMRQVVTDETAQISCPPELPSAAEIWWTGSRLPCLIDTPVVYEIDEDDEGELGSYLNESAPLFSIELLDAMKQAGVDNLEILDAELRLRSTGRVMHGYKAVNIVGIVDVADEENSRIESLEGLGNWVHSFTLDPAKARGALVFRLRQSPSIVVVHRRVRDAILKFDPMLISFENMNDFAS
jgi:hypothetical protein